MEVKYTTSKQASSTCDVETAALPVEAGEVLLDGPQRHGSHPVLDLGVRVLEGRDERGRVRRQRVQLQ